MFFCCALQKTFRKYILQKAELFKFAVGNKDSIVKLSDHSLSSSIIKVSEGDTEMTTLDNLLYNKERERITYLKADLEGYELKMLRGASRIIKNYRPKMAITCYHQENNYREIMKFVRELVSEYKYYLKGISQFTGKPVMIHLWVPHGKNQQ